MELAAGAVCPVVHWGMNLGARQMNPEAGAKKSEIAAQPKTVMEPGSVSEQIIRLDKLVAHSAAAGYGLNVTVVYEEAATRKWAREIYERAARVAGTEAIRATWWRVNDLSEPGVLAGAVSTAMRADVIIVAGRGAEGLPLPFYVWVNSWLAHRAGRAGAVVALLGAAEKKSSHSGRVTEYLRQVARQGRLEFVRATRPLEAILD
jgi:hypothetical protein